MTKPWEHMSRDEKLDYIKDQLEAINASLAVLSKQARASEESSSLLREYTVK